MSSITTTAEPHETTVIEQEFHTGGVITTSLAHSVHDTYSAFLSPLLPILIENLGISKTAAGMLSVFYQGPSLLQPLIGHLGDRADLRMLVVLAPTLSAIIFTILGLSPSYAVIALLLVIGGFNSAGLHAIGPVITGQLGGRSLGRAMSFWMVGGELGRTLGPMITVTAVSYLTPSGLPALIPGGILASLIVYVRINRLPDWRPPASETIAWQNAVAQMKPVLLPLALVLAARSLLVMSLSTFLPTYMTDQGESLWTAGASLSIMQAAGVAGALLGGSLSDRLGRRLVMVSMSAAAPIFALIFLYTPQGLLRMMVLVAVGFTLLSTTPVLMALVQERVAGGRALANGIFMAFNFLITSAAVVIIGVLGDRLGLQSALLTGTIVMLIGTPFVFLLFKKNRSHA